MGRTHDKALIQYTRILAIGALLLISSMFLISCAGKRPSNLGVTASKLVACPPTPNCVSSDAEDRVHNVSAFLLDIPATEAWGIVREIVLKMPRTNIVSESPGYLHAECKSAVFDFVDDLELHLRPDDGIIAIRSASRLGNSDFGVNRQRVEELRASLIIWGVLR